jgi:O-antigen/teichoic acid export membrane protein
MHTIVEYFKVASNPAREKCDSNGSGHFKASFIKANLVVSAATALLAARGVILMPLLIKALGTAGYGTFMLIASGSAFLHNLTAESFGFHCKRYLPAASSCAERKGIFYQQFWVQCAFLVGLGTILALARPITDSLLFKSGAKYSMPFVFCLLMGTMLCYQAGTYFRLTKRMKWFAVAHSCTPYLEIAVLALLLFMRFPITLNVALAANIAGLFAIGLFLLRQIIAEIGIKSPSFNIADFWKDLRLSAPLAATLVVDFMLSSGDRFVISWLLSPYEVGLYGPSYSIGTIIRFIPSTLIYILPVYLSQLVDNGKELQARELIDRLANIYLLIAIPFLAGSIIFAQPVLAMVANPQVAAEGRIIMPIVAAAVIFLGLSQIMGEVLFIRLRTSVIFHANATAAIVNLMLNVVLIGWFRNIAIAGFTTLLSYIVAFWLMRRGLGAAWRINYNWLKCIRASLAALCMGGIGFFLLEILPKSPCGTMLCITVSMIVYIICAFGFGAFCMDEVRIFTAALRLQRSTSSQGLQTNSI